MAIIKAAQGNHTFNSIALELIPISGDFHRTMEVQFFSWYTPDILLDHCKEDWNKGGGIGSYFSLNNQSAVLLGWRCTSKPFTWDVCLYVNTVTKSFWTTSFTTVSADDKIKVHFRKKSTSMDVSLNVNNINYSTIKINGCSKIMRIRNPWHGGQCPTPIKSFSLYHTWTRL